MVEFFFLKLHPNGDREELIGRVNPQHPIARAAQQKHGISQQEVS